MHDAPVSPLPAWENFYVIVGTAAATLTGLMFVVISFTSRARTRVNQQNVAISAFNTPTVVHFSVALAVAAILCAPWQALWAAAVLLGIIGLGGVIYVIVIVRRLRYLENYKPVIEDWVWHGIFPFAAYIALIVAALMLSGNPMPALFGIGAATMLLLFIGIHNAWDIVTYMTVAFPSSETESQDQHP